jgi:hypothetical protein
LPIYRSISKAKDIILSEIAVTRPLNGDVEINQNCAPKRKEALEEALGELTKIDFYELKVLFGEQTKQKFLSILGHIHGLKAEKTSDTHKNEQMELLLAELNDVHDIFLPYMDFSKYKKNKK